MAEVNHTEWEERSKKGQVCARFLCSNKPTTQCPKCSNHYCYEHLNSHLHIVSDEEIEEDRNKVEDLR